MASNSGTSPGTLGGNATVVFGGWSANGLINGSSLAGANGTLTLVASSTQTGGVGTQLASAAITPGTPIYVWVFGFNFALGTYDLAISFT